MAKTVNKPIHTHQRMPQRIRMETLLRKGKERAKEKANRANWAKVKERKGTEEAAEEVDGDGG